MSISSELIQLSNNKAAIKAAISAKSPSVSPTDDLSQWPTSIGSIVELKGETKTVTPTTSQQTITPTSGKNGITQITVNPVTSSIDANIVDGNIKKDVVILGVTGTYEGSGGGSVQGYNVSFTQSDGQLGSITCYKSDGTTQVLTSNDFSTETASDVVYVGMVVGYESTSINNSNISYYGSGFYSQNGTLLIHLLGNTTISKSDLCLLKGTKVTLADNSERNIEDITFDDDLLVWDFDNGCLSKAKPIWIKKKEVLDYYFANKYKSGKDLLTTGQSDTGWGHRTFDMNKNKFIYTTESVSDNIFTLDGIDTHMSCTRIEEPCEFYNIITERHFNLFANRILTSCSLNNLYPIKDMKYVKDGRRLRYISDYKDIPQNWFDGLRLAENNSDIEKLNKYVLNLLRSNKDA